MAEHSEISAVQAGDVGEAREKGWSRRGFCTAMGFVALGALPGFGLLNTNKQPIMVNSKGVLFQDSTRCVACRRCELACTEFKEGFGSSHLARVKVGRNMPIGSGTDFTYATNEGKYGNMRVAADTCKQCPHPVPCAEACPMGAIIADSTTGARRIVASKCIGCGICNTACPWAMPTLNKATKKSTKCDLCGGKPECARACPTGALRYVKWRDLRFTAPIVQSGIMPASTTTDCSQCHN